VIEDEIRGGLQKHVPWVVRDGDGKRHDDDRDIGDQQPAGYTLEGRTGPC